MKQEQINDQLIVSSTSVLLVYPYLTLLMYLLFSDLTAQWISFSSLSVRYPWYTVPKWPAKDLRNMQVSNRKRMYYKEEKKQCSKSRWIAVMYVPLPMIWSCWILTLLYGIKTFFTSSNRSGRRADIEIAWVWSKGAAAESIDPAYCRLENIVLEPWNGETVRPTHSSCWRMDALYEYAMYQVGFYTL